MTNFLWGVYPYICISLFFVIPIIRMIFRPFTWSTRASGLFNRKLLGFASLLFHWGILTVFVGHVAGLIGGLLGIDSWIGFFYWSALVGGIMSLTGSLLALLRRIFVPEVRAMSQSDDYIVHLFLIAILGLALYQVIIYKIFGIAYTASSWFATIWTFSPQPELMSSASTLTKWHLFLAMTFFAYFPFTKLVHFWTIPLNYFVRPYQVMRTVRYRFQQKWEYALRSDKSFLMYSLVFVAAGSIFISQYLGAPKLPGGKPIQVNTRNELTGYPLYVSQCARCHGINGLGDGRGYKSPTFATFPRNLVTGKYRFISTNNGVASDEDLYRILVHGLPSAGMPSFAQFSDQQLRSLVEVLKQFWKERPQPGDAIQVGLRPSDTETLKKQGAELFSINCVMCHGPKGAGDGPLAKSLFDTRDELTVPADLSAGHIKAGQTSDQLYLRIAAGIPGAKGDGFLMPSFASNLTPEQIWSIVDYLESEILPKRNSHEP